MSDKSSRFIKDFFHYFISSKSKILTNKNLSTPCLLNKKDENGNNYFNEKTSLLKTKLIQREQILEKFKQKLNQVDQQLLLYNKSLQEDSSLSSSYSSPYCYLSLYALELL
ncbi:unnamed protein product [Rotaria sp. Silwood1]|nr:unnamed protein product [Rotaria sp. Silwood1]